MEFQETKYMKKSECEIYIQDLLSKHSILFDIGEGMESIYAQGTNADDAAELTNDIFSSQDIFNTADSVLTMIENDDKLGCINFRTSYSEAYGQPVVEISDYSDSCKHLIK